MRRTTRASTRRCSTRRRSGPAILRWSQRSRRSNSRRSRSTSRTRTARPGFRDGAGQPRHRRRLRSAGYDLACAACATCWRPKVINAAIVGLGRWGRTLRQLRARARAARSASPPATPDSRLGRGVLCRERDRAQRRSRQILADPAIDAVVFATPHSQHGAQVERTAAAGKHVFMEKPFTLDVKSAEAALDAVARAGVAAGCRLSSHGFTRR